MDKFDLDVNTIIPSDNNSCVLSVSAVMDDEFYEFFGKHDNKDDYLRCFRMSIIYEMKQNTKHDWRWKYIHKVIRTSIITTDNDDAIECIIELRCKKTLLGHLDIMRLEVCIGVMVCLLYARFFIGYLRDKLRKR